MNSQNTTEISTSPAQTANALQVTSTEPQAEDVSVIEFEKAPLTDISFGF